MYGSNLGQDTDLGTETSVSSRTSFGRFFRSALKVTLISAERTSSETLYK